MRHLHILLIVHVEDGLIHVLLNLQELDVLIEVHLVLVILLKYSV